MCVNLNALMNSVKSVTIKTTMKYVRALALPSLYVCSFAYSRARDMFARMNFWMWIQ